MLERQGFVLWFTGLSGAGKSTVAGLVMRELQGRGVAIESLDGDEVRTHLSRGLTFSQEDRDINVERIGFVAGLLSKHGIGVVTAAISPYVATRAKVRDMATNFVEIHVDATVEACIERDVKGLYKKALAGEIPQFTGVSDPYESPESPEIRLKTTEERPAESAQRVLSWLEDQGLIPRGK